MAHSSTTPTVGRSLRALVVTAVRWRDVPSDVAEHAATATIKAFGRSTVLTPSLERRSEAYFWAVVKRRLFRRRAASAATARFVLQAVVDDLAASGRDDSSIWEEIERGWCDKLPADVLAEYRARLCA